MLDREYATRTHKTAIRLAETIERLGFSPDLAAMAWLLVTMIGQIVAGIVTIDETLAGLMVDARTPPSAGERRRRITARDTDQRRVRRAEAMEAKA